MSPLVQQYLRNKAFRHNVPNANTLELTEDMKRWLSRDWDDFARRLSYEEASKAQAADQALELAEQRKRFVDYFNEVCDVEMSIELADGGVEAFHRLASKMTVAQFEHVGWRLFQSGPAYC